MATHPLFLVELLEMILLETDIRTLLGSASRVCRFWNKLINTSSYLQTVLFIRPSVKPLLPNQPREVNPLLPLIWHRILRRNNSTPSELLHIRPLEPWIQSIYLLRQEASWRRMLIQQPPTRRLSIVRTDHFRKEAPLTTIEIGGEGFGFLRLGDLHRLVNETCIVPGTEVRVLWNSGTAMSVLQDFYERLRGQTSNYLGNCECILVNDSSLDFPMPPYRIQERLQMENREVQFLVNRCMGLYSDE
ncbi:hypothetical protein P170DRAFT_509682 [Aspergillus steynii IBT 23096]|uniref:F-box domain-containing protein n=1 Tax=Aspergillus steynii IBT 23096 TaxID=1392250 RepID=A0A2I2G833_9EURO|nr:uncharacterized protein P170DRAFT_509682 [Aspergillus steynii IBT 23096]PLB49031.1 hypothetical protein P170DRAFT_509682 [Aspergillus steynii IBT 23096]